jgi:hypothetical protein
MWEFPMDDGFTMFTGLDRAGNPLEVGVVEAEDGTVVIIHAMPARPKFLR